MMGLFAFLRVYRWVVGGSGASFDVHGIGIVILVKSNGVVVVVSQAETMRSLGLIRTIIDRLRSSHGPVSCSLSRLENGLAHTVVLCRNRQRRRQAVQDQLLALVGVARGGACQDVFRYLCELLFYVRQEDESLLLVGLNVCELVVQVVDIDAVFGVV